jgi:hypothetical protein
VITVVGVGWVEDVILEEIVFANVIRFLLVNSELVCSFVFEYELN